MTTTVLKDVYTERRKAVEELRALYDTAGADELDAAQKATEERLQKAITDLEQREANLIELAEAEKRAAKAAETSSVPEPAAKTEPAKRAESTLDAELQALVRGERATVTIGYESRDLTAGTATDGPELIPTTLFGELHDLIEEESPIMGLARVLRTSGGEDLVFPRVTSHSAASLIAEGGTVTESDPQFDTVTLGAYKYGFMVQVSTELEQDSAFSVREFVVRQGGMALGRGVDAAFVSGSGSSQPAGVDTATTGLTTAGTAAVTADELIEAQHSVIAPQRNRASWLFNDSTIEAVRKLKDGDNNYIWATGLQPGAPSTLLGRPVASDPNLASMATGNTFGVYGDMSGFYVRFAGGVRIDRSIDYAFGNDLVSYRFLVRVDSDIVDTTGIRKLVNA